MQNQHQVKVNTLDYLINVGVCLSIFWQFSSQYAFIPYPTFINFWTQVPPNTVILPLKNMREKTLHNTSLIIWFLKVFNPIRLFHPLCLLVSEEMSIQCHYSIPYGGIQKLRWPFFALFWPPTYLRLTYLLNRLIK